MIKLVSIDKISNHPENPRKDLGDLTELAESIKQSGILQNLTLVPIEGKEDEFYALIGNRRLAAAKLAGLQRVPCAIVNMDKKTQVATMLLENMQRSDLTVYEQAQGFQMMMDLGETVSDISEKTGFSESTVRRRMKLLELDQDKLKESVQRGATLMDYIELEKIKDIKLRNEVLETIGTENFNYRLKWAIDKEKRDKRLAEIIEQLEKFAVKVEDTIGLAYKACYSLSSEGEIEIPEDSEETEYFYEVQYGYVYLYYKNSESEEQSKEKLERERKEQLRREKCSKLNNISRRAYELRLDFIKNISNTKARKNMDAIIENTLYAMVEGYYGLNYERMANIMDIDISDEEDIQWEDIAKHIWKQPELNLLKTTYCTMDSPNESYYRWDCTYLQNEDLDHIYDFLQKLGYKMSEEEKQLQDGTHELFCPMVKEVEKND